MRWLVAVHRVEKGEFVGQGIDETGECTVVTCICKRDMTFIESEFKNGLYMSFMWEMWKWLVRPINLRRTRSKGGISI